MEARAIAKGLRIPPRKARLIVDLIRGKDVQKADEIVNVLDLHTLEDLIPSVRRHK